MMQKQCVWMMDSVYVNRCWRLGDIYQPRVLSTSTTSTTTTTTTTTTRVVGKAAVGSNYKHDQKSEYYYY